MPAQPMTMAPAPSSSLSRRPMSIMRASVASPVAVSATDMSSGRSRGAGTPPGDGEVLVTGERVLLHDGTAVLAVDENLRYGPLKAGYHGGASPARA